MEWKSKKAETKELFPRESEEFISFFCPTSFETDCYMIFFPPSRLIFLSVKKEISHTPFSCIFLFLSAFQVCRNCRSLSFFSFFLKSILPRIHLPRSNHWVFYNSFFYDNCSLSLSVFVFFFFFFFFGKFLWQNWQFYSFFPDKNGWLSCFKLV